MQKVSVIIPTYNYGHFIKDAIDSVFNQTYKNIECIIIDNGSTDNTKEMIKPFLELTNFKYFETENKGVSNARNFGVQQSTGDLILFLDADDLIQINKLESAVNLFSFNHKIDLVYSEARYFKEASRSKLYFNINCDDFNDKPWMKTISGYGTELVKMQLGGNNFVISSPIFKKSILNKAMPFDNTLSHNEDWDFWLRLTLQNNNYIFDGNENALSLIRVHKTSASNNLFKMQINGLRVLLKNKEAIHKFNLNEQLKVRISEHIKAIKKTLSKLSRNDFIEKIDELEKYNLCYLLFNKKKVNKTMLKIKLKLQYLFK